MVNDNKMEKRLRALIEGALEGRTEDTDAAVEAVTTALMPIISPTAMKRAHESHMMGAYREGYKAGNIAGRFARWHTQIWRASQVFRSLREPANDQQAERFERYNY